MRIPTKEELERAIGVGLNRSQYDSFLRAVGAETEQTSASAELHELRRDVEELRESIAAAALKNRSDVVRVADVKQGATLGDLLAELQAIRTALELQRFK